MASSGDYAASKFNLAAQGRRQPGSTFKVMVMMTALRQGVDINKTTYVSKPLNFIDKKTGRRRSRSTPTTTATAGTRRSSTASCSSDNTVFQQLDLDLGPEQVRQTAYDMGITSHLDALPGRGPRRPADRRLPARDDARVHDDQHGGWRVNPVAIKKVEFPDGHVDTSLGQRKRVKVFTDGQTHEATLAMEANVAARHRHATPSSAVPRPARPAPRAASRTPGSTASPPR